MRIFYIKPILYFLFSFLTTLDGLASDELWLRLSNQFVHSEDLMTIVIEGSQERVFLPASDYVYPVEHEGARGMVFVEEGRVNFLNVAKRTCIKTFQFNQNYKHGYVYDEAKSEFTLILNPSNGEPYFCTLGGDRLQGATLHGELRGKQIRQGWISKQFQMFLVHAGEDLKAARKKLPAVRYGPELGELLIFNDDGAIIFREAASGARFLDEEVLILSRGYNICIYRWVESRFELLSTIKGADFQVRPSFKSGNSHGVDYSLSVFDVTGSWCDLYALSRDSIELKATLDQKEFDGPLAMNKNRHVWNGEDFMTFVSFSDKDFVSKILNYRLKSSTFVVTRKVLSQYEPLAIFSF